VTVKVTLVGESGGSCGGGDGYAGFEHAAGGANTLGELQGMRRQSGAFADRADEAELADAGRVGRFAAWRSIAA
jgi:hypothetical protein